MRAMTLVLLVSALAPGAVHAQVGGATGIKVETAKVSTGSVSGYAPPQGPQTSLVVREGGSLFLAFAGKSGSQYGIFFRAKSGESDWDEPVALSQEGVYGLFPDLFVDSDGGVHCVWIDARRHQRGKVKSYRLVYARRPPGGNWTAPVELAVGIDPNPPRMTGDAQGRIYLLWSNRAESGAANRLHLFRSGDGGNVWVPLNSGFASTGEAGDAFQPDMIVDASGRLYVAWIDRTPSERGAVAVNISVDQGQTWLSEPVVVNKDLKIGAATPSLFMAKERLFVLWQTQTLTPNGRLSELWVDCSPDLGRSWAGNRMVCSERDVTGLTGRLFAVGDNVELAWIGKPAIGADSLQEKTFWKGDSYLDAGAKKIVLFAGDASRFEYLGGGTTGGQPSLFVCEVEGIETGKLWLLVRNPDSGGWDSIAVNQRRPGWDPRFPAMACDDGECYLVYQEVGRIRMIGEPDRRQGDIMISKVGLGPN